MPKRTQCNPLSWQAAATESWPVMLASTVLGLFLHQTFSPISNLFVRFAELARVDTAIWLDEIEDVAAALYTIGFYISLLHNEIFIQQQKCYIPLWKAILISCYICPGPLKTITTPRNPYALGSKANLESPRDAHRTMRCWDGRARLGTGPELQVPFMSCRAHEGFQGRVLKIEDCHGLRD